MPAPSSLSELAVKYAAPLREAELKKVTPNSRYLLLHYLYNVLKLPTARNQKKDTLPSTDAATMERFDHPFPGRITRWRSNSRALKSVQGALKFCFPAERFAGAVPSPTGEKAVFWFAAIGYDNIERSFPMSEKSIPINLHKPGRAAFITPAPSEPTADILAADPGNEDLLLALISGEEAKVRDVEVEVA